MLKLQNPDNTTTTTLFKPGKFGDDSEPFLDYASLVLSLEARKNYTHDQVVELVMKLYKQHKRIIGGLESKVEFHNLYLRHKEAQ